MTAARHRSAPAVAAERPDGPELKGKAPGGMWWVAWRQHRWQGLVVLALIAVVIAALIAFREKIIAAFTAAGCDLTAGSCTDASGRDIWWNDGFSTWSGLLHAVVLLGPIVLGVFAGAPIFTREFSRGTHVFALTQSVSRWRWWAAKVTVTGVPLVAGLVALGFVTGWVDGTTGYTAHQGLAVSHFVVRGIIPAAHGLVAFAIAVTAGILIRSTVAALVTGLILAGLAVAGLATLQPHVLPASRYTETIQSQMHGTAPGPAMQDPDLMWRGSGYLTAKGGEVSTLVMAQCSQLASEAGNKAAGITGGDEVFVGSDGVVAATAAPGSQDSAKYDKAYRTTLLDCTRSKGIVAQYFDYLPGSMLWPLRWAMTGIAAVLAALLLLLGGVRLRAAVGKR